MYLPSDCYSVNIQACLSVEGDSRKVDGALRSKPETVPVNVEDWSSLNVSVEPADTGHRATLQCPVGASWSDLASLIEGLRLS